MKYLYGDSVACPFQSNFLAAFETFIDAASVAVKLDFEFARIDEKTAAAAAARERALETVEGFHRKAMDALSRLIKDYNDPNTSEYARQVREHAEKVVEEARANCDRARDQDAKTAGVEAERKRKEVLASVERFLKTDLLDTLGSTVTMRLADGQNQLAAVLSNPADIITSYTLSSKLAPWQAPVKVSTLVPGLELQVGVRKSWITGSVARSALNIEDFVIGGFEISDDAAEIRLRKRPEQPDVLVFKLRREDDKLIADVHRTDSEDPNDGALDEDDRRQLEQLWQMLRKSVSEPLRSRNRLVGVRVGDKDLLEGKRLLPLVEKVIEAISPTVKEIVRRSPNPAELSIKLENDDGRREEIYVRKAALVGKLEALDAPAREVFTPLGLLRTEALTADDVDVDV
jgi:hypothetical protein